MFNNVWKKVEKMVDDGKHAAAKHFAAAAEMDGVSSIVSNLPVNVPQRLDIEGYRLKIVKLLGEGLYMNPN